MTQESDFFYFSHQVSLDDVDIDQYKELTESKALVKYLLAFDHSPHFIIDFCKQEVMCYCDRNVTIMHNTAEVEKYIRENLLILDEKYIKTFNPNRSLDYYAQTNFLFVICLSVFRLQWNPIAPSKRRDI